MLSPNCKVKLDDAVGASGDHLYANPERLAYQRDLGDFGAQEWKSPPTGGLEISA